MENNDEKKVEEQPKVEEQAKVESPTESLSTNANMQMEPVVENAEEEKPKKKSKAGLIIVIVLLLLVAVGTSAVYILFFNKGNNEVKKTESDTKEYKSEYRMTGNNIQNFDLAFAKIENKEVNKAYSPLSIKYTLGMLNEGSSGNTKKEIEAVIGDYTVKKYDNNEHMSFANAIFIRDTFADKIQDGYKTNLSSKYNAEVITDKFESATPMNNWVKNKTFNLVDNLLTDDSVKQENFELINALAIDMNWINRIQCANAKLPEGMDQIHYFVNYVHEKYSDYIDIIEDDNYPTITFNGKDNTKTVQVGASFNRYDIVKDKGEDNIRKTVSEDMTKFLKENPDQVEVCPKVEEYVNTYIKEINTNYKQESASTDFYISDNDNVKIFAKDLQTYGNTTLQYVGIMPKKKALTEYVKDVDAKTLKEEINNMKEVKLENFKEGTITKIKGNIPLFKIDYKLELLEDLGKLGLKDIFDIKKADFSKMLKDEKQAITSANHKATIEFSNDGIKAAAATSIGGGGATSACQYDYIYDVPVETIDVTFDKPYLFLIRDKNSGEVWFVGTVYEPLTK